MAKHTAGPAAKLFEFDTDASDILTGAVAGAAVHVGFAKGKSVADNAMKGAMMGAALAIILPTAANVVDKIMPKKPDSPPAPGPKPK